MLGQVKTWNSVFRYFGISEGLTTTFQTAPSGDDYDKAKNELGRRMVFV